jgi:hypothetical protein
VVSHFEACEVPTAYMEDKCFTLGHLCPNDYGAEDEMQRDGIGNLHKYEQVDWLLNEE